MEGAFKKSGVPLFAACELSSIDTILLEPTRDRKRDSGGGK